MKRRWNSSFLKLSLGLGLLAGLYSCDKSDALGEDNNKVVRTPYGLYLGAEDGSIVHTTDGDAFHIVFPPDGYPASKIVAFGDDIVMVKANVHHSDNAGRTFNPKYTQHEEHPWESMVLGSHSHGRIYLATKEGRGIAYSEDYGKNWQVEDELLPENLPPSYRISSFAELGNGTVFGYSNKSNLLLKKQEVDSEWEPVTSEGFFPVTGTRYYLVSNKTHLFLVDYNGKGGVWYSEDEGNFWTRIEQGDLPRHINYNAGVSGNYGSSFVVGTDKGAYYNDNGRFVEAFGGLDIDTEVKTLSFKRNIFKNDATKNYVYMGSSTGIYRSEDGGRTWDLVSHGVYKKPYKSSF